MPNTQKPKAWLPVIALVSAGSLLILGFVRVDTARVIALLSKLGPASAGLILLPYTLALIFETLGVKIAFSMMGARPSYASLLSVRVATEAFALVLPGGVVLAESTRVPLLVSRSHVDSPTAVASVAIRKYLLLAAQAPYLVGSVLLGWSALGLASTTLLGQSRLGWILLGSGLVVAAAAVGLRMALAGGSLAERLYRILCRLPVAALKRALLREQSVFQRTDLGIQRFFAGQRMPEGLAIGFVLLAWFCESLETFLILSLLETNLGFCSVLSFEAALALARNLAFVFPAGLGIQDFGYVLFLQALGVPHATESAAAFAILKRSKELFFAGLSAVVLLYPRARLESSETEWV